MMRLFTRTPGNGVIGNFIPVGPELSEKLTSREGGTKLPCLGWVDCDCYVLFFLAFGLVRSIKMTGTLDPNGLQADISASYCNNERTNCLCADRIFSFLPVASSNSCPLSIQPNGKSPV